MDKPAKVGGVRFDPFGLRGLVIVWCLWLLLSWSITLGMSATAHAVRWMIFSAVFGLMAVWPAVRLSQQGLRGSRRGRAVWGTLLDWFCLVGIFQVVVWPLMLLGRWSDQQTLWLDLAVLAWSLLTGAIVGLGRLLPGSGGRWGAMGVCMLLLLGEPVWLAVGGTTGGSQMGVSPIQALWELTTTVQPFDPSKWSAVVLSVGAAAVLAWCVLGVMAGVGMGNRKAKKLES